MILVFSGLHGTGKSTIAERIAEKYNLTFYSTGMAFRELAVEKSMNLEEFSKYVETHLEIDKELDNKIIQMAKKGKESGQGYVFDGQLPAYILGVNLDFSIQLQCDLQIRIERMMGRDGQDFEAKKQETLVREESERQRFIQLYNIDVLDPELITKTYGMIIDTSDKNIDEVFEICDQRIAELNSSN